MAIQPKDKPSLPKAKQEGVFQEFDDLVGQLRGMLDNLQGRVMSLTNDMQVSADIAARVANILDLDQLLPQLAEEIKEGFDLHHVNIYLVDDARENLVLQAASGQEGRRLLASGYRIPLNDLSNLAAEVTRAEQAIIINNVEANTQYDFEDLVPGTVAKMAVPMITRGRVIGVLAVQSDRVDAFDDTDVRVKTTLAEQIAVAIENADAFTRVEEARQELSQANLVVENSATVLFRWRADDNWTVDFVSDNVDQFGYTAQELLSGEIPYAEMVHPDDLERVAAEVQQYTRQGTDRFQQEYRIITKDGDVRWTDDRTAIERDEDGNPLYYQGVVIDITERKQAEEEVRESQRLLQVIIDTMPARVFWKDKNLVYQYCNTLFAQDAGYDSPEDIIGKTDLELAWTDEEAEAFRTDDLEVLETNTAKTDIEEPQTTPEGVQWLLTSKVPLRDAAGKAIGVLGMYSNITDRKQAEERETLAYEIGQQLNTMQDPDELLQFAVDLLASGLDYYHAHIYRYEPENESLAVAAGLGEAGQVMIEEEHKINYAAERSLVASAARTLEPVVVQNVYENPAHLPNPLIPDTVAEAALPLFIGSDLLGVLDVQANTENAFDDEEIRLLSLVANQLSIALSNARQIEQAERRLREIGLANEAGRVINTYDDTEEMLKELMSLMAQSLGADIAAYIDYNKETDTWQGVAAYGMTDEAVKAIHTTGSDFPHGIDAMQRREIVAIDNAYEYENFPMEYAESLGIQSAAAVPIMGQNDPIATVFITFNNRFHNWLNSEVALLDTIANQISTSIEARQSQEDRNRIINNTLDFIGSAGFDGYFRELNPTWSRILGFTEEELKSKPFIEFVHPDDVEATQAEAAKLAEGVPAINFVNRYATKDGGWRWLSWNSTPDYEREMIYFVTRDITEQRKAEEELRSLGILVDNSPDFISYTDLEQNVLFVNQGGLQMTGYTFEEATQMKIPDLHTSEGLAIVVEQGLPLIDRGETWRGENELLCKDGTTIPVEQTIFSLTNEAGETIAYATIMQDITDRKQAEAELQKRAIQLETVADVALQVANILEVEDMLQSVVDLTKEQFGLYHAHVYVLEDDVLRLYAGAGEPGRNMVESGHSIPLANPNSIVATTARNRESVISNHVRRDRDFMPNPLLPRTRAELAVPLIFNDKLMGVLDVQADQADYFTEEDATVMGILAGQIAVSIQNARSFESVQRISAESERRARELETVAQVSTTTSTLLDVDELLKQVSDVTKDAFDLYHAHIYLFNEENEMLQLAAGAGEAGDLMKANEHRIPLRHDSSVVAQAARDRRGVRVNDVTASPTFLPNPILPSTRAEMALPMIVGDELVGVLDVQSERIGRFGEEDVVIKSTLAAQVAVAVQNARAYKEQQAVAERLREVDLLKNQFLASMSHELRTPLNSIIGYSEVLLDGGDGELNEDAQEDVEIIYTSGKHLLAIINDILDLAKIEANQMKLHKEPIDVVKILHDVIKTNEVLIGDRPIDLCFESEVDELIVPVDELRIRQVVMNLFSNAAKFTEEGSITIELHMEDDETASIAVTDTGIGIDPEGMSIVFDQFRQVDGTSTRKAGGTGLGLTITRHLVQMHGGEIYVDSAVGEGSKFWFTLPLIEREPEQEMQTA